MFRNTAFMLQTLLKQLYMIIRLLNKSQITTTLKLYVSLSWLPIENMNTGILFTMLFAYY